MIREVCEGDARRYLQGHPKLVEDNFEIYISCPLPKGVKLSLYNLNKLDNLNKLNANRECGPQSEGQLKCPLGNFAI